MRPTDILIRKLRNDTYIDDEDAAAIEKLQVHVRDVPVHTAIVRTGDRPKTCCLVMKGFACRSKVSHAGKRQILSFHVPGDIPDLQSLFLKTMDHDLLTISEATIGHVEHSDILRMIDRRPSLAHALWRETLIDASIFREWIMSLGAHDAGARMAHLFAELHFRLTTVGLVRDNQFDFPITQTDLADALGISAVHANRILQKFRADGLLDIRRGRVAQVDIEKAAELCGFDPAYLHQLKSTS